MQQEVIEEDLDQEARTVRAIRRALGKLTVAGKQRVMRYLRDVYDSRVSEGPPSPRLPGL